MMRKQSLVDGAEDGAGFGPFLTLMMADLVQRNGVVGIFGFTGYLKLMVDGISMRNMARGIKEKSSKIRR